MTALQSWYAPCGRREEDGHRGHGTPLLLYLRMRRFLWPHFKRVLEMVRATREYSILCDGPHVREYPRFAELARGEMEGVDYLVHKVQTESRILIMAPHGGGIEPGTSEIARAVAYPGWSHYDFEGMKRSGNSTLHITSTLFDEPRAVRMVAGHSVVVTLHGCAGSRPRVYTGGLHSALVQSIDQALHELGVETGVRVDLSGKDAKNLCNRGTSGLGVQLELTWGLRLLMFRDLTRSGRLQTSPVFNSFVGALKSAIAEHALLTDH